MPDMIYTPRGAALEYAALACNVYKGCTHGCRYCYAPATLHRTREAFHENAEPKDNVLARLDRDIQKLDPQTTPEILCSFLGDLYQPGATADLTRGVLTRLCNARLRFTVLTKGGTRASRDFDILRESRARFGTSLVWSDQRDADQYEPNAASIADRIAAIEQAKAAGIPTWVSLEPVIDAQQALQVVRRLYPIVNTWAVGKINHQSELARQTNWAAFHADITTLLDDVSATYFIKQSLLDASAAQGGTEA